METILNKAKRYDEALGKARRYYDEYKTRDNIIYVEDMEDMFPELKESDDELMIQYFKDLAPFDNADELYEKYGFSHKDAIAWLEKQRGHDKFINGIQVGDKVTRNEDGVLVNLSKLNRVANKQGEHKPTDKVESNFKVGDWVATSYGKVNQVVSVDKDGDGYTLNDGVYFSGSWCDMYHLWTIQDAKDGDVLAWDDSKCIALFKNIYDEDSFNSYGFVGGCTGTFESRQSYHDIEGAHPATKEHRDLLFQKMHESGYEWDAEKKELIKIEQNPAWSEEDEEIYRKFICAMRASACGFPEEEKFVEQVDNWFKSLKDRYSWRPSEEQLEGLKEAIAFFGCTKTRREQLQSLYEQLKKLRE